MLTTAQRMQVRMYLGWSERFHQTDSALEQAMNALDQSQSTDAEAQVISYLTELGTIDTSITAAYVNLQATQVGSIKLDGPRQIAVLRGEGRRIVGRIASLLGVEVRHDSFAPAGPSQRASVHGMMPQGNGSGGNGGLPPMG